MFENIIAGFFALGLLALIVLATFFSAGVFYDTAELMVNSQSVDACIVRCDTKIERMSKKIRYKKVPVAKLQDGSLVVGGYWLYRKKSLV